MNKFLVAIRKNSIIGPIAVTVYRLPKEIKLYFRTKSVIQRVKNKERKIFYLGIPAHANLGDLAQGECIRKWIRQHYKDRIVVEIETNALVNTHFSVRTLLREAYKPSDIIVFQSGYTTTDLGGFADEMHRAVMTDLPNAKMLMMPQTIFFVNRANAAKTAECYNNIQHLFFLSRDRVSYLKAKEMFPDISVQLYPDIVTTLIGNYYFEYERKGILFCCRDDEEQYYTDQQIVALMEQCSELEPVNKTDTTKRGTANKIVACAAKYLEDEIDQYAHYKLIITDRYHGTIFSLVAGTPVVILKTTDHKVVTGAEWFKGVYDDYVYLADSPEHAYSIAKTVLNKQLDYKLTSYFDKKYYDKLPEQFDKAME